MRAGDALQAAALTALRGIAGLGVHDGAPVQAALPYAVAEAGPESDWSHKSGVGREVRLAVTLRDEGETPLRLRRMLEAAETAVGAIGGTGEGWRIVTMQLLRSRIVREPGPPTGSGQAGGAATWAGVAEFRARMLAA